MKYLVVGLHCSGKVEIMKTLQDMGVPCGKIYTNVDIKNDRYEFISDNDMNEIFENNAYIFFREIANNSFFCYECLSLYEFDHNSVFFLSPDQLNAIPIAFLKEPVCIIWVDSNTQSRKQRYHDEGRDYNWNMEEDIENQNIKDSINTMYRVSKNNVIYFYNEDPKRVATVIYSVYKHPELLYNFVKYFN